ncbi:MAG TPA: peptidylprolyl isomerase [Candidatus Sulfotelmatobacter sp.]|nr:peptidylprolyl isomerase [Candidatus Sulfotelmatobacter sp.]
MVTRCALILLCFSLAAAGQTKPKTPNQGTAPGKSTTAASAQAPTAVIHTTSGDMKCELFPAKAPKAVANFIGLARGTKTWNDPATSKPVHGKPLYDGVIFHRVIPEFMVQTGDPSGTGSGDVGFEFQDELHADLLFDQPGRLAMANRGPNTNSSQFFITEKEVPFLNPCLEPNGCMGGRRPPNSGYTIFGQCDPDTVELVKKIARMPCAGGTACNGNNSRPQNPVKITHIDIQGAGKGAATTPAAKKPAVGKKATLPKSSIPN